MSALVEDAAQTWVLADVESGDVERIGDGRGQRRGACGSVHGRKRARRDPELSSRPRLQPVRPRIAARTSDFVVGGLRASPGSPAYVVCGIGPDLPGDGCVTFCVLGHGSQLPRVVGLVVVLVVALGVGRRGVTARPVDHVVVQDDVVVEGQQASLHPGSGPQPYPSHRQDGSGEFGCGAQNRFATRLPEHVARVRFVDQRDRVARRSAQDVVGRLEDEDRGGIALCVEGERAGQFQIVAAAAVHAGSQGQAAELGTHRGVWGAPGSVEVRLRQGVMGLRHGEAAFLDGSVSNDSWREAENHPFDGAHVARDDRAAGV
jgi:hypothetical protein